MNSRLLRLPFALMLALGAATGAHAQSKQTAQRDTTVLPVWNNASGKVEAVLLLEPTGETVTGARWKFGNNTLDAAFGLETGDSLGLVCNRRQGNMGSIGSLISNCSVASMGLDQPNASQRISAGASLGRSGGKLGVAAGSGHDTLPAWLSPGNAAVGQRIEQNDLTVFGQKNLGREGFVSIGGTVAHARLVPAADLPASITNQWDSKSLSVGGGYGAFSANIVGRVVDTPGQPGKWEGLGLGLTWRTPWSGQLTVGAENVVTRGKNPFSLNNNGVDEGTVPYVRYEQDL